MVERVLDRLLAVLERLRLDYRMLGYPENGRRRSIDVFVSGGGRRVFIKVVEDVGRVRREDVRELRGVSGVLGAAPLLIGERDRGEELEDIVAYEKMGVYALSPEGFERAVETGIYVVKKRGRFYMRLDAERLREERERRGLSLGVLASLIGATRRAVYEYERSSMDIELGKALRILDVLGEEVFRPIEVLRPPEPRSELGSVDEEGERRIAEEIVRRGGVVVHLRRTVVDLAARVGERTSVIIYEHRGEDSGRIVRRGEEAAKVVEATSTEAIAVVEGGEAARDLEAMGFEVVTPEELRERLSAGGAPNTGGSARRRGAPDGLGGEESGC